MRFVSIQGAAEQAKTVARRFPFVLASALVAAVTAQTMVDAGPGQERPIRVLFAALLGIPLLTAIATAAERGRWPSRRTTVMTAGAVGVLLLFLVLSFGWTSTMHTTRVAHFAVALHLLAAVLPFTGTELTRGFWQYNRILFQRFLIATLFSGVLFGGLSLALVAIDQLFAVRVDEDLYLRLFFFLAFVFHPWFLLGGIPADLNELDEREDYPAVLKVFAQFILIPVVSIYLAILTAYLVRILVTHSWPSGWLGWLVSGVAAAGTLALLLVHPLRERADSRWVNAYGRWFFVALLPAAGMLIVAISQRIAQYGVTERRYFLAVLALWLAGVAIWYAVTASRNIKIIPASLCLVALATFMGPWSAYSVSRSSQATRLRDLLAQHDVSVESRASGVNERLSFSVRREIAASVRYLVDVHGAASLGMVTPSLRGIAGARAGTNTRLAADSVTRAALEQLGVGYVGPWETQPSNQYINFTAQPYNTHVDVSGWDALLRAQLKQPFSIVSDADTLVSRWNDTTRVLYLLVRGDTVVQVPLDSLIELAHAETTRPLPPPTPGPPDPTGAIPRPVARPIVIDAQGGGYRVRLIVLSVSAANLPGRRILYAAEADVLVGRVQRGGGGT